MFMLFAIIVVSLLFMSTVSITSILAEIEVMGNELDKIEQNGNETAKHPKISEEAGQQLQEEVKKFVGRYRARLEELDIKGQEMSATYSKLLVHKQHCTIARGL
jgi:hypothetical protein